MKINYFLSLRQEAKAANNVKNDYNAICLINADIEVDFAPPLDYQEIIPM